MHQPTVLCAVENRDLAQIYRKALSGEGYRVVVVHDGSLPVLLADGQAVVSAATGRADLLAEGLVDTQMVPIDAGGLLLHPRVQGLRRDRYKLLALLDLPEALQ